jgi:hypothetical protein
LSSPNQVQCVFSLYVHYVYCALCAWTILTGIVSLQFCKSNVQLADSSQLTELCWNVIKMAFQHCKKFQCLKTCYSCWPKNLI